MEIYFYITVMILFSIGTYGLLTRRNMIKMTICLNIMEASLLIFLVSLGYRDQGDYPIIRSGVEQYVDPLPHAFALTAIVIGASMTAVMLAFAIKIYKRYDTLDISEIRRLNG
ncbi:MAG: sodium:proton antiporter [bacterium]